MNDYLHELLDLIDKLESSLKIKLETTEKDIIYIKNIHADSQTDLYKISNNIFNDKIMLPYHNNVFKKNKSDDSFKISNDAPIKEPKLIDPQAILNIL